MKMKIGNIITGTSGIEYRIIRPICSGGQGSAWLVEQLPGNEKYVFKILNENDPEKLYGKSQNIQALYTNTGLQSENKKATTFRFMLPQDTYRVREGGKMVFGYFMEHADGCADLNDMFCNGEFDAMPLPDRYRFMTKICDGLQLLEKSDLCFQSISLTDLLYNKSTGLLYFIDCDNIAAQTDVEKGIHAYIKGTGWFTAPEVAYAGVNAATNADRYAMAVVFYMILTGSPDSPYHGKKLYECSPPPKDMIEAATDEDYRDDLGTDWLVFIFDPKDQTNSIADIYRNSSSSGCRELRRRLDSCIDNWSVVPPELQDMFVTAFRDPLNQECYRSRPSAASWNRALNRVLSGQTGRTEKKTE